MSRILFVSHSSELYGAQRSLLGLVIGIKSKHFDVGVLVPSQGPLTRALAEQDIPAFVHPYKGWLLRSANPIKGIYHALYNVQAAARIGIWLRHHHFDLVYSNTLDCPMGALLALVLRTQHIWHARELVRNGLGAHFGLGTGIAMKVIGKSPVRVICNSRAVFSEMAKYMPETKLAVIYPGFPELDQMPSVNRLPGRLDLRGRTIRLCLAGSLHPVKGHKDALQAMAALSSSGFNFELFIAGSGDGRYLGQLQTLASKLGISSQVHWKGFVPNCLDMFRSSDLVLVCSQCEAFGRTAVEAMAVGRPVIGTDSGGTKEVIENGITGLLYPPNEPDKLAQNILRLVRDPDLYESISVNAAQRARERFGLDRAVMETLSIIGELLRSDFRR